MLRTFALLLSGLLVSNITLAADNGIYLGVGVSQSQVDYDAGGLKFDGDDTKYKAIVGVRPLDWLAFEANYVDFGVIDAAAVSQELKGVDAFVVGLFEIGLVDFYAKAGLIRWDQSIDVAGLNILDSSGTDAAYGAGIQVHLGSLSVRGEYEKFDIRNTTDAGLMTLAVTWTFL
jgi:OmpA-OmpF porin, OOP family